jgi:hypothetical protein
MSGEVIKLGSAALSQFIFQTGSTVTLSDSGIQECSIKAFWGDSTTVLDNIPAAGTTYDDIFGNNFLPADFKLDLSENGSAQIEFQGGQTATVTFSFKRPDPNKTGAASRKVSLDTSYRFITSDVFNFGQEVGDTADTAATNAFGIPEPVVTVRYNSDTFPSVGAQPTVESTTSAGGGGRSALFPKTINAPQSTSPTAGFPTCENIVVDIPYTFYQAIQQPASIDVTTQIFRITYGPNPKGWTMVGIKADPVSGESFWDVTETWHRHYIIISGVILSTTSVPYTGP